MDGDVKVAAVFGAARPPGLGLEVALCMADAGYAVACIDRTTPGGAKGSSDVGDSATMERLVEDIRARGRRAHRVEVDLNQEGAPDATVAKLVEVLGRIDVACVLTGGVGPEIGDGLLVDVTPESLGRAVQLNFVTPFLVARACARQIIKQGGGGSIVFQSSHAAVVHTPRKSAFGAARAGLNFLVKCWATELGPHNIRVNAVCPLAIAPGGDATRNPGLAESLKHSGKNLDALTRDSIPLGRAQSPAETASVIRFLALEATFVTGESWVVAGGSQSRSAG